MHSQTHTTHTQHASGPTYKNMSQHKNTFRLSGEELRKMNLMLPRGYKLITRDELAKRETQKTTLPKKKASMQVYIPAAPIKEPPPYSPPPPEVRVSEPVKKEEPSNEPSIMHFNPAPPALNPPPPPVLPLPQGSEEAVKTSQGLLDKIQHHPSYVFLFHSSKKHETDISLREIEIKVASGGDKYRLTDLEADLQRFCLIAYKNNERSSEAYRYTTELEHYLTQIVKVDRSYDKKASPYYSTSGRPPGSLAKKKMQPAKGAYQPYTQTKMPVPSEKRLLGQMIKKLPSESLQHVCFILFESTENRDYHFDLDTLHVKKFRELEDYVKKCMEKTGEWDQELLKDEEISNESEFIIENDDD